MKPVNTSRLDLVSLRGAKLADAILAGCMLIKADFEGADLERTDLRGADLRIARNFTQEQIEQAYGGASQRQPAQNTSLPDHLRAPAAWSKPIWEQKQGCGEA
jgi:uncharacterized protein YjbI with pentapeptide repeats